MTISEFAPWLVKRRSLVLITVGTALYVAFLGLRDFWYPDEPDIAEVCRAMFISGDWVAPRRNGVIWVDYPPLIYWTGCLSSWLLGGMSEFSLRLPSALAGIALALVTCSAVSRWATPRAGLWAGMLTLTFPQLVLQATGYRTDMLFSVFIGAGMFTYARGVNERRWWPRVWGFGLLGIAVLAKGPLGLLLPGLVLTLWHAARREWRQLLSLAPLGLLSVAIALPWFVMCAKAMGADNILAEIWAQNFQRFGSGFRGHDRPPYYYVANIWPDLAPWSVLLPFAIWWIVRQGVWRDRNVQLALWWFGTFFVFLSFAATKRELYLLPAYPAAALLLARWLAALGRSDATSKEPDPRPAQYFVAALALLLPIAAGLAGLAAAVIGFVVHRWEIAGFYREVALDLRWPLALLAVVALPSSLWLRRAWRSGDAREGLHRAATVIVMVWLVVLGAIMPAFNPAKTYAPPSRWAGSQIGSDSHIGLFFHPSWLGFHKMGAFAYYSGKRVDRLESEAEMIEFFDNHPHSLVLLHADAAAEIFASQTTDWRACVVSPPADMRTDDGGVIAGRHPLYILRAP